MLLLHASLVNERIFAAMRNVHVRDVLRTERKSLVSMFNIRKGDGHG